MSAFKGTPGPWEVINGTDVYARLGARNAAGVEAAARDGWFIADCASIPTTNKDGEQCELSFRETHANARLIAAAPELLEACQALMDATNEDGMTNSMLLGFAIEMAGNAIAKATGGQP